MVCCGGPSISNRKLIAFQSIPTPEYIFTHAGDIDQVPIDGFVLDMIYDETNEFRLVNFGPVALSWEQLSSTYRYLSPTTFKNVTRNVILTNCRPGNMNWFDSGWLSAIQNNFVLAAKMARILQYPGIIFDAEEYEGPVWDISALPTFGIYTDAQHRAAAEAAGYNFARAMMAEYPTMKFFTTIPNVGFLGDTSFELYSWFLNGITNGLNSSISGNLVLGEENTYTALNEGDFIYYNQHAYDDVLTNPNLTPNWLAHLSKFFSFSPTGGMQFWSHTDFSLNFLTPALCETICNYALQYSNEYTWVYTRGISWFANQLTDDVIDPPYVEAIRNSRRTNGMRVW